jgi:hypothetical protein
VVRTAATRSAGGAALAVGVGLVALGQLLLVLLGPLTRASGTYVTRSGPALLAPDSQSYLADAELGVPLIEHGWPIWGYLSLLRIGHLFGDAPSFAVLVQSTVTAAAAAALFEFMRRRHGWLAGLGASAALAVNPMTAQWIRFVLTEAVFQPLMVLCLLAAVRVKERPTRSRRILLLVLGLTAALLRPNGVLVLASCLALLALTVARPRSRQLALGVTAALVPVLLLASLDATGQPGEATLTEQWYAGVVIEGTEDVRVTIVMPHPVDPGDITEAALLRYMLANPVDSVRLVGSRILAEVAQVRPHYPRAANALIGVGIALYLVTAAVGALERGSAYLRRPTAILSLPLLGLVGVTFAVPEARYGWSGLIVLAPLVGIGVARILGAEIRPAVGPPEDREVARADESGEGSALDREPPP